MKIRPITMEKASAMAECFAEVGIPLTPRSILSYGELDVQGKRQVFECVEELRGTLMQVDSVEGDEAAILFATTNRRHTTAPRRLVLDFSAGARHPMDAMLHGARSIECTDRPDEAFSPTVMSRGA